MDSSLCQFARLTGYDIHAKGENVALVKCAEFSKFYTRETGIIILWGVILCVREKERDRRTERSK